jgi:predicted RNA-binding protein YlxR (DUF448 family)
MPQGSVNKGAQRQKHVPQRTCVACRRTDAKRGLIRVVRDEAGRVAVDVSGRRNGRGAYLCHDQRCWETAVKRKALERALRLDQLHPEDRGALLAFAQTLEPADGPGAGGPPVDQPSD